MSAASHTTPSEPRENLFNAADIEAILHEHGWLAPSAERPEALGGWLARAAFLLGPHVADRAALADLLALVFHYDAATILREQASQAILCRDQARDVIRELALAVLDGPAVDSDRFNAIIEIIKAHVHFTSRELFYPLRLALAGRPGGGELDRVILLLDAAAQTPGLAPVKGARQRMLEFCAALE